MRMSAFGGKAEINGGGGNTCAAALTRSGNNALEAAVFAFCSK